jgi:hypothetical protein
MKRSLRVPAMFSERTQLAFNRDTDYPYPNLRRDGENNLSVPDKNQILAQVAVSYFTLHIYVTKT